MESNLKTETLESQVLGREIEIREMSAGGQSKLSDASAAGKDNVFLAALTCQFCVPEWNEENVEDIADNLSLDALMEIGNACVKLSGLEAIEDDSKNSEAGQDVNSS